MQAQQGAIHAWEVLWLQCLQNRYFQMQAAKRLLTTQSIVQIVLDGYTTDRSDGVTLSIPQELRDTFKKCCSLLDRAAPLLTSPVVAGSTTTANTNLNTDEGTVRARDADGLSLNASVNVVQAYRLSKLALRLSSELSSHPSLLPATHFPVEQVVSVYAPYWVPCLIPLLKAMRAVW